MIPELRESFNRRFTAGHYEQLRSMLDAQSETPVQFRVAETPVFVPAALLDTIAADGAMLTQHLLADVEYLAAARRAIPAGYAVANETAHPHFLTADFALVREGDGRTGAAAG